MDGQWQPPESWESEGKESQQIRPQCFEGEGSLLWHPTEYKGILKREFFESVDFYSTYESDVSLGTLIYFASIF